jgi:CBS domain-containing protein
VYDYAAGKVDWLAAGLPTVRAEPGPRRALEVADPHPPTCRPETSVAELGDRPVLVVNPENVVLGRVRPARYAGGVTAEEVMEPGPTTVRAHEPLDDLLSRMERRRVGEVVVTTPEGRLLGVVRRT